MITFTMPERIVTTFTTRAGTSTVKEEAKGKYATRCEKALRDQVRHCALMPEATYQLRITRFGMRLDFNASTAEATFHALPDHVAGWCTDEYSEMINWTKVAADFNNIIEAVDLL